MYPRTILLSLSLSLLAACGDGDGDSDSSASTDLFEGYDTSSVSAPVLMPIQPLNPVSPSPSITGYSVSPALPDGLSLDGTTGVISGTPTELVGPTTFQVTATNAGGEEDTDPVTIEVRGPIVDLSTDHALVRSVEEVPDPVALLPGGLGLATAGPSVTEPGVGVTDAPLPAEQDLATAGDGPDVDAGTVPDGDDATEDFVATVSMDLTELSADPWTFDVAPPYDDDGLDPTPPGFPFDTSTVEVEDGELQLTTELSSEGLGPFDSTSIPTEHLEHRQVLPTTDAVSVDWHEHGDAFYFAYAVFGDVTLVRYDPDAAGGPTFEEVVDLVPDESDEAEVLGISGDWLLVHLADADGTRLYAYDLAEDELHEVGDVGTGGDFLADEHVWLDGDLYLVSDESTPADVVLRWVPPEGALDAALERVSYTAPLATDSDQAHGLVAHEGALYFVATDGTSDNLYRFDPLTMGQQRLSTDDQAPVEELASVGDVLYAVAQGPGGEKVFRLDQSEGRLVQISDTAGPSASDAPALFGELTNGLHLSAEDEDGVRKLYRYDPTTDPPTFEQIGDTAGEGNDDAYGELLQLDGTLLLAGTNAQGASKLYAYDYESGVLRQVVDLNGPAVGDEPSDMMALEDGQVALAMDSVAAGGFALFLYRPETGSVVLVADPFGSGVDDDVFTLGVDDGRVYFRADDAADGVHVHALE